MITLSTNTADRAEEIICASLVLQQRYHLKIDKKAVYVDLDKLRAYANKCAQGYRQNLAKCRDFADHEILFRAVRDLLAETSSEYVKAIKEKK